MDINELARRSGVSAATVSRALNDRPEVSPATRQRILALAGQLGYAPNASARALASRRSGLVGLLWDTDYRSEGQQHPFLQDLLVGLKHALSERGQGLLLLPITGTPDPSGYVRLAQQYNLDGVVLMGVDQHTAQVAALLDSPLPCVALDLTVRGPRSVSIGSDNRAGAAGAVRHLYGLGHRRIATITGPRDMWPAAERLTGYQEQLTRLGLPHRPDYVQAGDFFPDSGATAMRRLLALPEPPTAVFVGGDAMAIAAIQAAERDGRSVPGDIAVVGFDNIEAAELVRPALTTIAQDYRQFGATAVGALVDLTVPGSPVPDPVLLPTQLVVRRSCGSDLPPAHEHATVRA
ncbi:MAG: LacI family DNA-binding transcriptional regulator [Actinocatenispora sp.]